MKHACAGFALALVCYGCSSVAYFPPPDGPPPEPMVVTVELPVTPSAAFDRTVAALTAQGYVIGEGSRESGLIKTTVIPGETVVRGGLVVLIVRTEYFIRATLTPAETGSQVRLSATMQSTTEAGNSKDSMPERPIVTSCGTEGPEDALAMCRDRLERIRGWLEAVAARLQP